MRSRNQPHDRSSPRRGSVLIYVVWAVLLLSLMAAGIGSQVLFALNLSQRLLEQLRAAYAARSAVVTIARMLAQDPTPTFDGVGDPWFDTHGRLNEYSLAGGIVNVSAGVRSNGQQRYGLIDENGKINLNTAPAEVLQRLLDTTGGLREEDAVEVTAAIEDWRDPDTDERPFGAEGYYYRSRSPGYDCKDGPFENVEELLLIRGMTPDVFQRIEPYVTVYGSGRLNVNTADRAAIHALGLSQAGEAGLLAFRAGEDGQQDTGDERALTSTASFESDLKSYVPVSDLARLKRLVDAKFLGTTSEAFRAIIQAHTERPNSQMTVVCVMDRKGHIQFWSER